MKDWKIIAISAALAFLFSFISGLLGQVSIGVIFFRAVLGAFIFGALGFGISILLRKYLPEIFEINSGLPSEDKGDLTQIHEPSEISSKADNSVSDRPLIDISIGDETEQAVSEKSPDSKSISADENSISGKNELVEEVVETGKTEESDDNNQIPGNIDALPDMGLFSNSFENSVSEDGDNSSSSGAVTLDIMGEEQDPEFVAKAVRTMVKKDQEG